MLKPLVAVRRMITIALASAIAVLALTFALGRRSAPAAIRHTCAPPDRQFLVAAHSNMAQLAFWSDQLAHGGATPSLVVSQARDEAEQVAAIHPVDPTLQGVRTLIDGVLQEYGNAIRAKAHGRSGDLHMRRSWRLAAEVQVLLGAVQPQLGSLGCDVTPLLAGSS